MRAVTPSAWWRWRGRGHPHDLVRDHPLVHCGPALDAGRGVPTEECLIERDTACADEFRARAVRPARLCSWCAATVLRFDRGEVLRILEPSR